MASQFTDVRSKSTAANAMETCLEKVRLANEYETATSEYCRNVAALNTRIGVIPQTTYEDIRSASEHTRLISEQARLNLDQHVSEHGC